MATIAHKKPTMNELSFGNFNIHLQVSNNGSDARHHPEQSGRHRTTKDLCYRVQRELP